MLRLVGWLVLGLMVARLMLALVLRCRLMSALSLCHLPSLDLLLLLLMYTILNRYGLLLRC